MGKGNFNVYGSFSRFVPGAADLVILFAWFLAGVFAGNAVSLLFSAFLPPQIAFETGMPVAYICMFIPPMMYASSKSRRAPLDFSGIALDRNGIAPLGWLTVIPVLVISTIATGIVAEWSSSFLPEMPESLEMLMNSLTGGNFLLNFLSVSILAPVFEEWLCRGMVMRGLLGNGSKPWIATVVSALVFALIHLNPWQAVPAFLMGCMFGYVYYRTGSLKLTMLMHFTNNTFALLCGQVDSLDKYSTWKDISGEYYPIVLSSAAIITVLTVILFKRTRTEW